jgi:hypothetical protein
MPDHFGVVADWQFSSRIRTSQRIKPCQTDPQGFSDSSSWMPQVRREPESHEARIEIYHPDRLPAGRGVRRHPNAHARRGRWGLRSQPATVSEATCERLDACNTLPGSVEECIQETDTGLNSLPQNQAAEVELALKQCLAHPSCDGLVECLAAIFQ